MVHIRQREQRGGAGWFGASGGNQTMQIHVGHGKDFDLYFGVAGGSCCRF